jgi:hypothetical protein
VSSTELGWRCVLSAAGAAAIEFQTNGASGTVLKKRTYAVL